MVEGLLATRLLQEIATTPASHHGTNPEMDFIKGPGCREAGVMIYKLMEAAERRWKKLTGAHLVALTRAGARFENGEILYRTGLLTSQRIDGLYPP
jgi:hypothetical protein